MSAPIVIFGGAGFIGSNLADSLLAQGERVRIFDNLSRAGVELNARWLRSRYGENLELIVGDVRDAEAVHAAVRGAKQVFHFAAQVAVTTSLLNPIEDFEINARGTLNVLEAIRAQPNPPPLLFTSTNKVYGGLEDLEFIKDGPRYAPADPSVRLQGLSEARPLDFKSPYGCSKGAADQYVLDHARSFDLKAVVFRMSCIYGPRQFGNEDQGWVAHFLIQALRGEPLTLYGDGMQVRDILFVEDLVRAFRLAMGNIERIGGRAYNIGGGPKQTISLIELLAKIHALNGARPEVSFEDWRTGDQRYYVSDYRRFARATGWSPRVGVDEGVERLFGWIRDELVEAEVATDQESAGAPA